MKFSAVLILAGTLHLSATVYAQSQKVKLSGGKCNLKELLTSIREQTGLSFIYKDEQIKHVDNIQVYEGEASVVEVLNMCLTNTGLIYEIDNDVIIINSKNSIQEEKLSISGRVVDETGMPIPGVNIVIEGGRTGVITDVDGKYQIDVMKGDVLKFSFIGMKTEVIIIKDKTKVDVQLTSEIASLEEVSVQGHGQVVRRESATASVTTVKAVNLRNGGGDLVESLVGNAAGMFSSSQGGLPVALTEDEANVKLALRGITSFQKDASTQPLVLLDGVEASILDLSRIDVDDVETFSILKDAGATAVYGARGANGVIYVTTKKGKDGDMRTSVRVEGIWSEPASEIEMTNGVDYMTLYNETLTSRVQGTIPKYSADRIGRTASGKYPNWLYPNNDWIDKVFKRGAFNKHYTLNVRGGTKKVQYYTSVGFNQDGGNLRTDQLNEFDVNIKNKRTTFRTNLNVNLTSTAKLVLNSFSTYDDYTGPLANPHEIYLSAFRSSQVDYPAVYPADEDHDWPHILFGNRQGKAGDNPYMLTHYGYKARKRFSSINQLEYIQSLSHVIKGLEFRASANMTKTGYFETPYSTSPAKYALDNYDYIDGKHTLVALNPIDARRTLEVPGKGGQNKQNSQTTTGFQMKLQHLASWKNHTD